VINGGLKVALNITKKAHKGIPFAISREWADILIGEFRLQFTCGPGCMTGEQSALFNYEGEIIRLHQDWMKRWTLYHGQWEPDPHFAGD
jgi:hypothetical protein